MKNSCVQIYCGDGKGKTTAAVGLAVRASGAGLSVLFMQFMKNGSSSELEQLKQLKNITVKTVENRFGFTWNMTQEQKSELNSINTDAISRCIRAMEEQTYDVIILDEIISAYNQNLVSQDLVEQIVNNHNETEVVLTARNPNDKLTEMSGSVNGCV